MLEEAWADLLPHQPRMLSNLPEHFSYIPYIRFVTPSSTHLPFIPQEDRIVTTVGETIVFSLRETIPTMGTLTADCPRLDSHCPHKLATSCRLTATGSCCACADERPHSRTYRVYIDGVGFVQRGTRWQGYCWYCQEFWSNRLAATYPPLETTQTQIPQIPDQTEFLERWRIAVIGESLKEVSPGFLPRTLDQLRARRPNDATRPENCFRRERLPEEDEERQDEPQPSLEAALDSLLEEASEDEANSRAEGRRSQEQLLHREMLGRPRPMTRTERHLQRARERFARVFGSREEVQQDDYQSPISVMFNRAFDRYRQAEELRASGDTIAPNTAPLSSSERREIEEQLLWGVMQESRRNELEPSVTMTSEVGSIDSVAAVPSTSAPPSESMTTTTSRLPPSRPLDPTDYRGTMVHLEEELRRLQRAINRNPPNSPALTLDNQPNRPPPMTEEQMTKNLACQVCYSLISDTVLLPCGHMIMCEYCADVVIPVKHQHVPTKGSKCPKCRKDVRQRFRIHMN
ncbi:hypothetical protein CC78DRAFT_611758 [Lojkania enalia]|uniref:RING-type domain-containing protein n=1 Tax=Lojkania enalia TaxID=147567 RepID=A0A9P4NBE1_9PLEO|nr:hypothetical protein CC78DRAFT_611758 [Didymosphaeria enalia]